ncbi:hypothetical protein O6H91_09G121700 [Diphasiastrum complanatum]|uniref:Uncharacterized protein n=1 Tax=Diphasiastrum complanatum TaxID=34168 RepID=A0ACC2CTU8_DIPCM|nr:hypothetical protein O6H91_09G121700 [Diphasiastrum complanatum]
MEKWGYGHEKGNERTTTPKTCGIHISKARQKPVSKSLRSCLMLPVGRIFRYLKTGRYAKRISATAPIYLTAVLEYLVAEMLEVAGYACIDHKRKRIITRHIMLGVRCDDELGNLLARVTFAQSGVQPKIHRELLPKRLQNLEGLDAENQTKLFIPIL